MRACYILYSPILTEPQLVCFVVFDRWRNGSPVSVKYFEPSKTASIQKELYVLALAVAAGEQIFPPYAELSKYIFSPSH